MSAADAVAVGSIAHVLRTTFKDLYEVIPEPVEEEEEEEEEEENPEEPEYQLDADGNPILDDDGNPIPVEVEGEGEENPEEQSEENPEEGEEGEEEEELAQPEEEEEEENDDDDDLDDEVDPEIHVNEGAIKVDQIEAELEQQLDQSNGLVQYLMDQHDKAHEEDKEEALRLKDEGLLVKAEIPIGPSFLLLDAAIMNQFGHFGTNLVSARRLLQDNLDTILEQSGNGPKKEKTVRYIESTPGYLRDTGSNSIRTQILKKISTSTGGFKPGPASLSNRTVDYSKARLDRTKKRMKGKSGEPSMTAEELDVNIKVLERMNKRLQFLRNPRHDDKNPNSAGNKTLLKNPETRVTRPSGPGEHGHFLAVPPKVEFTEYETGVVYEQAILIRNVSQVSRRLRVLPPATSHFSLSSVDYPGGEDGMVAPGMSCKCTIRFAPDSLADYNDSISAITETNKFMLPVEAHRLPPSLTIPQTLTGKSCLLGSSSSNIYQCANYGGPARFRLLPDSEWPNPTTAHRKDYVNIEPFQITPTEFALRNGESVDIAVNYTPTDVGDHHRQFVMVCDNCQVKAFNVTGTASFIKLEVAAIQGVQIDLAAANTTPPDLLLFEPLPPGATGQQTIEVRNCTPLELEFYWEMENSSSEGGSGSGADMVLGGKPAFRAEPSQGTFPASSTLSFKFSFCPTDVVNYSVLSKLRIRQVPKCAADSDGSNYTTELADLSCLEMKLVGAGEACTVAMDPPLLLFPGSLLPQESYSQFVTIKNLSIAPTAFDFQDAIFSSGDAAVRVSPSAGRLDAGGERRLQVTVTPRAVGEFKLALPCEVSHSAGEKFLLRISGKVEGARLVIASPEIDFGLISVGGKATHVLRFANKSGIPAEWSFLQVPKHRLPMSKAQLENDMNNRDKRSGSPKSQSSAASAVSNKKSKKKKNATGAAECRLKVFPESGIIPPHGECSVTVDCLAGQPERLRAALQCMVVNGASQYVGVRGEVQSPKVYLDLHGDGNLNMGLGTSYVGVPMVRKVKITNLSNLTADYKWDVESPSGPSKLFSARFDPPEGTLESKSTQEFTFTFTPKIAGKVSTLFACNVKGMLAPLGFSLDTLVKGLVMAYSLLPEEQDSPPSILDLTPPGAEPEAPPVPALPRLVFGEWEKVEDIAEDADADAPPINLGCKLFQRQKLRVLMCNYSGIPTTFNVEAKKYKYTPPENDDFVITGIASTAGSVGTGTMGDIMGTTARGKQKQKLLDAEVEKEKFKSDLGKDTVTANVQLMEDRVVLRGGKGMALVADPPFGTLGAWENQVVEVTLFNNMPGEYKDELLIDVHGMGATTSLKVAANVVGCPLSLAKECVGLDSVALPPALKWGEIIHSQPEVTKVIRVKNTGPIDAMLKWRVTDRDGGDTRLVDTALDVDEEGGISINLGYHEKQEIIPPFTVEPVSQLVPKHHEATFNVTLHTPEAAEQCVALMTADAEWLHPEEGDSSSRPSSVSSALGSGKPAGGTTGATALQQGLPDCLRLHLVGETIEPFLTLDKGYQKKKAKDSQSSRQLVQFKTWSTNQQDHDSRHQKIVLTNNTTTPVTFSLNTALPFAISKTKCLGPKMQGMASTVKGNTSAAAASDHSQFTLQQQENIQVSLTFSEPLVMPGSQKNKAVAIGDKTLKLKMQYPPPGDKSWLNIAYANGSHQAVGLQATVFKPMVIVAPEQFKFGMQHVEGTKDTKLYLTNPTDVDAEWSITHIPRPKPKSRAQKAAVASAAAAAPGGTLPEDVPDVFEFDFDQGVLSGPSLPVDSADAFLPKDFNRKDDAVFGKFQRKEKMPLGITVKFNPQLPIRYKSRFRFEVVKGEGVDIVLEGAGTLDEAGLAKPDRPLRTTQHKI